MRLPSPLAARCTLLLALSTALPVLASPAGEVHQHGLSQLAVVRDGATLQIDLQGPGYNFVGFEHAPATAEQSAEITRVREQLAQAKALLLPANSACVLQAAQIQVPDAKAAGHAHDHAHDHDHDHDDKPGHAHAAPGADASHRHEHAPAKVADASAPAAGHTHGADHDHDHDHDHAAADEHDHDHDDGHAHNDWQATYTFTCPGNAAVALDLSGLFQALPRTSELALQALGPAGSHGATLTAAAPRATLP